MEGKLLFLELVEFVCRILSFLSIICVYNQYGSCKVLSWYFSKCCQYRDTRLTDPSHLDTVQIPYILIQCKSHTSWCSANPILLDTVQILYFLIQCKFHTSLCSANPIHLDTVQIPYILIQCKSHTSWCSANPIHLDAVQIPHFLMQCKSHTSWCSTNPIHLDQTCEQSNRSNRKVIDWSQLRCNSNSNRLKFFKCNSNRLKFYLLLLLLSIIFLL